MENKERLYVLGTGQAVCLHYENTCFALTHGEGYFLVDGGGGSSIIKNITRMNIDWTQIRYAFLSHEHTDHLLGMVWVVRYIAELMNWNRYEGDFVLYGNSITLEKLRKVCFLLLKKQQTDLLDLRIHLCVVTDGQEVEIYGNRYTFFDIHSRKAKQFGFRMERPSGLCLVFLGDEPYSEEVFPYMKNTDWLLAEAFCLYSEKDRYNPYELFHSTVKESCIIAENFNVKNLVLWHTEDESTFGCRKSVYQKEGQQFYSGNLLVPDDFEIIELE